MVLEDTKSRGTKGYREQKVLGKKKYFGREREEEGFEKKKLRGDKRLGKKTRFWEKQGLGGGEGGEQTVLRRKCWEKDVEKKGLGKKVFKCLAKVFKKKSFGYVSSSHSVGHPQPL